jgi:hypothetical protein
VYGVGAYVSVSAVPGGGGPKAIPG